MALFYRKATLFTNTGEYLYIKIAAPARLEKVRYFKNNIMQKSYFKMKIKLQPELIDRIDR